MTVPRAPIIIGINVTFMFHSFFNSLARSRYLSFFSLSFNFTLWSARIAILIIILFWEFFTPALADGFLLGFEGQQVSSSFQDSSQYYSSWLRYSQRYDGSTLQASCPPGPKVESKSLAGYHLEVVRSIPGHNFSSSERDLKKLLMRDTTKALRGEWKNVALVIQIKFKIPGIWVQQKAPEEDRREQLWKRYEYSKQNE